MSVTVSILTSNPPGPQRIQLEAPATITTIKGAISESYEIFRMIWPKTGNLINTSWVISHCIFWQARKGSPGGTKWPAKLSVMQFDFGGIRWWIRKMEKETEIHGEPREKERKTEIGIVDVLLIRFMPSMFPCCSVCDFTLSEYLIASGRGTSKIRCSITSHTSPLNHI